MYVLGGKTAWHFPFYFCFNSAFKVLINFKSAPLPHSDKFNSEKKFLIPIRVCVYALSLSFKIFDSSFFVNIITLSI